MNPGGSGFAVTLPLLREGLVAGLPDFEVDGLWRGGYPRFGTISVPLSSVDTLACDLRPAPDAAPAGAKQEKRGVCMWFNTVVFLPTALRCGTLTRFSFPCTAVLFCLSHRKLETPGHFHSSLLSKTGLSEKDSVRESHILFGDEGP